MGRIIAIVNQKGGVGKTTTAVNLSAALAINGRRVLLIDIDPQGNASSGLGVEKNSLDATLLDVLIDDVPIKDVLVATEHPTLAVAPSNHDLVGADLELATKPGRETILKRQIATITNDFDYIFIDCPPSLSVLTVNALVAADSLLVPLQSEYYALEGVSSLMYTVNLAKKQLNTSLELEGVVLTMFDSRTNLARQVASEVGEFFNDLVFKTVIPRNVRLSESPSFGQSIFSYDAQSAGAVAYRKLAIELEKRLAKLGVQPAAGELAQPPRKVSNA